LSHLILAPPKGDTQHRHQAEFTGGDACDADKPRIQCRCKSPHLNQALSALDGRALFTI
jgi:hypothetical protein